MPAPPNARSPPEYARNGRRERIAKKPAALLGRKFVEPIQ
jgi:hypothetical protein